MKLTTHHLRAGAALLLAGVLLAGCDQSSSDEKHIKVGVINGAEQDVAEVAKKVAKEKYGLDVELVDLAVRCYRTMRQIMASLMRTSSSIDPFLNKIIRRMVINW